MGVPILDKINVTGFSSSKNVKKAMEEKSKLFGYIGMDVWDMKKEGKINMPELDPYFEKQNQYVADLQKQYQGKLASFARIDPNLGKDSEKILREALTDLGAKGLVLHPWEETFTINDKKVFPFMEICEEYQVPVLVESGYPWLAHCFQVANLAEKFPKLRFIMAHGGQFDSSGYAMTDVDFVMDTHDNLYIETSGYFSDEGIENTPKRLGNDRILFGSHFP